MAVDMFLKLDGVTGGSKNYSYKGWSDVNSFAWGMVSNRSSSVVTDKDMTSFREISISKQISTDSTAIMLLYAQGKTIDFAELKVLPQSTKKSDRLKYLTLHMEDVLIKSIITGGDASEDFFNEKIILLFSRVRYEYNAPINLSVKETGEKPEYVFDWDIVNNKEL
jgi:type VI secretion system secreted protein Hcp